MVAVRNALAQLAVDSSKVAANYREIQNANGAGLETLSLINFDAKTFLGDYTDTADTIDINPAAEAGKNFIDAANNMIDTFKTDVKFRYQYIMENWTVGSGRDAAQGAFDSFLANANKYREPLSDTTINITKSLQNYTF